MKRTKSAEDKILKKRQKIAELKDKLSEYEKSLEDYVEIGMILKFHYITYNNNMTIIIRFFGTHI